MLCDPLVKIESRHNISHKTIIYTTFFRAAPQGVTLAYDTTQDASYTCIFVKTHRLSPPHTWLQSKSDINSWKWLANTCYVAEFETYVPYVYIRRAQHKIWAQIHARMLPSHLLMCMCFRRSTNHFWFCLLPTMPSHALLPLCPVPPSRFQMAYHVHGE